MAPPLNQNPVVAKVLGDSEKNSDSNDSCDSEILPDSLALASVDQEQGRSIEEIGIEHNISIKNHISEEDNIKIKPNEEKES